MKIKDQLIDSREQTYDGTSRCTTVTVHETANTSVGADAQAHANLQSGGNSRQASWHIQVDDTEAIRSFPDEVRCWHAGSSAADSIAVEICVNSDGSRAGARANAAEVIAQLLDDNGLDEMNVVGHNYWTGKDCPHYLLGGGHWDSFIEDVRAHLNGDAPTKQESAASSGGSGESSSEQKTPVDPDKGKWPEAYLTVRDEHNKYSHRAWRDLMHRIGIEESSFTLELQTWLQQWPKYDVGPADDDWGARTTKALQRFLRDRGHYSGRIDGKREKWTIRGEFHYLNEQAEIIVNL